MHSFDLPWLSFNVDLNTVANWMRSNVGSSYVGCSADYDLTLHFNAPLTDMNKAGILEYWNGLTTASPEATKYTSASEQAVAAQATLTSAKAKLKALGLSDAEIAALVGN